MKHRLRVNVVTRRKGLFGTREVIRRKTVAVPGDPAARTKRGKWNAPAGSEAERLAKLYLLWKEELAEGNGEGRL